MKYTAMVRIGNSYCQMDWNEIGRWLNYCTKDKDVVWSVFMTADDGSVIKTYRRSDWTWGNTSKEGVK